MAKRIEELDCLKCVFIILMVAFHLSYIGDTYLLPIFDKLRLSPYFFGKARAVS